MREYTIRGLLSFTMVNLGWDSAHKQSRVPNSGWRIIGHQNERGLKRVLYYVVVRTVPVHTAPRIAAMTDKNVRNTDKKKESNPTNLSLKKIGVFYAQIRVENPKSNVAESIS